MTADGFAPTDRWRALTVFSVLLALYLATGSGRFHSDDEMSVFAVAASLAGRGAVTIDQIAWNQDLSGGVGRAMPDGQVYSKYGIGMALVLAPILSGWQHVPWAGLVPAAMLINGVATAMTGAMLYLVARRLATPPVAALGVALLYGVGTLAWVYARFLFGEPLVALCWVTAFWLLLPRGPLSGWAAFGAGACVAFALLVRSVSGLAAPIFLLLLLASGGRFRAIVAYSAPIGVGVAIVAAYNVMRFGSPFDSGYNPIEGFTAPFLEGALGLLVSPGRGALWYAPPIALGLVGAGYLWRRHRAATGTAALLIVVTIVVNALWHAWHGGWSWGPRLILPAVPFLLLLGAPLVASRAWWARTLTAVVALAGVAVTLLGVLVDFNAPLRELLIVRPELAAGVVFLTLWDWAASPIPAHARLLATHPWDTLWAAAPPTFGAAALGIIAFAGGALIGVWRRARVGRGLTIAAIALTVAYGVAGAATALTTPRLDDRERATAEAIETLRAQATPGDRLLVIGIGAAEPLLSRAPLWLPVTQILPDGDPVPALNARRIATAAQGHRLWTLQVGAPPVGPDNGVEVMIDSLAYKRDVQRVGEARLTSYVTAPPAAPTPSAVVFADRLRLTGWAARATADTILLDLWWQAERRLPANLTVSLRVTDADGRPVGQVDRVLTDGALPTDAWTIADPVHERLAIPLSSAAAGPAQLDLVVYPAGGRPWPTDVGDIASFGTVMIGDRMGNRRVETPPQWAP